MEIIDSHCHLFLEEFQDGSQNGLKDELKNELKIELQNELQNELKEGLKGGLQGELHGEATPLQPSPDEKPRLSLEQKKALERARQNKVSAIVNVALDVSSTLTVLENHSLVPWLHPTTGWHPNQADKLTRADLEKLAELALRPEIVAFGEIGLDYYRRPELADIQKKAFADLLEVAATAKKPVIIHCREAFADLMKILTPARSLLAGVLFHCFSESEKEARMVSDLGCHLSFAGPITFPKSLELRKALAAAPLDTIMIETDAPFLAPVPYRGKRNEPAYLIHHLQTVARVLDMEAEEAASLTSTNAKRFFGIKTEVASE